MGGRHLQLATLQDSNPVGMVVRSSSPQLAERQDPNRPGAAGRHALMVSSHLKILVSSPGSCADGQIRGSHKGYAVRL